MRAGPPCMDNTILHHYYITVAENREEAFVFIYVSDIEILLMKILPPGKGDKEGVKRVFCQQSAGGVCQVC